MVSNLPFRESNFLNLPTNRAFLDEYLASLIDLLPTPDYTVIYATTPRGDGTFPAFAEYPSNKGSPKAQPDPLTVQQRRNIPRGDSDNDDDRRNLPLFEKYQFLSPGTMFSGIYNQNRLMYGCDC